MTMPGNALPKIFSVPWDKAPPATPTTPSVVRPSVCSFVRPFLTLVDQGHIGWKCWKLIARTISPTPSLFVSQKPPTWRD